MDDFQLISNVSAIFEVNPDNLNERIGVSKRCWESWMKHGLPVLWRDFFKILLMALARKSKCVNCDSQFKPIVSPKGIMLEIQCVQCGAVNFRFILPGDYCDEEG